MENQIKRYKNSLLLFVSTLITISSFEARGQLADSPGVEWKRVTWMMNQADGSFETNQNLSGEDWWYSVNKMYNTNDEHVGYMAVGYSNFDGYLYDEGAPGPNDGCINNEEKINCDDFHAGNDKEGSTFQTIGLFDLSGRMYACRALNTGAIHGVVQSSDREHIVISGFAGALEDRLSAEWNGPSNGYLAVNPFLDQNDDMVYNTFSPCDTWGANQVSGGKHQYFSVLSLDMTLGVEWNYIYSAFDFVSNEDQPNYASNNEFIYDHTYGESYGITELSDGTYSVVGRMNPISSSSGHKDCFFVMNIAEDGSLNWKDLPVGTAKTSKAVSVKQKPGSTAYYVTGTYWHGDVTKNKIQLVQYLTTSSGQSTSDYLIDNSVESVLDDNTSNIGYDLDFDQNGNILLAAMTDLNEDALQSHRAEGYPRILTLHPSTAATQANTVTLPLSKAYDLKVGLTSTSDDGFAVITSQVNNPNTISGGEWNLTDFASAFPNIDIPYIQGDCSNSDYHIENWDSDAYLAKYVWNTSTSQWDFDWDKIIDTDEPRAEFPGQIKKQECVYEVIEADDGGLVFAGNTSHNHDDNYLVKVANPCMFEYEGDYDLPSDISEKFELGFNTYGYVLNNNLTLSDPSYKVKGIMLIPDGVTLTIDGSKIEFFDTRKGGIPTYIIVQKGGSLEIINGAKLTSSSDCDNTMWDGIEVIGTPQSDASSDQGFVRIQDESIIENAWTGLKVGSDREYLGSGSHGGGEIEVNGAIFRNCLVSVELKPYWGFDNRPNSYVNPSLIINTEFISNGFLNDAHYARSIHPNNYPAGTDVHILMDYYNGLTISNCSFTGASVVNDNVKATGIKAYNSTYRVALSDFDGLLRGVESSATFSARTPIIESNSFTGCIASGVFLKNHSYPRIIYNTFDLSHGSQYAVIEEGGGAPVLTLPVGVDEYMPIGLYLLDNLGYDVEENEFTHQGSGLKGIGMEVRNTTDYQKWTHEVYRNEFTNTVYASYGNKENDGDGQDPVFGLDFKCNTYNGNAYDILSTISPGVSVRQGVLNGASGPAGNIFDGCTMVQSELRNEVNHYNYIHHASTSSEVVVPANGCYTGNVTLIESGFNFNSENSCRTNFPRHKKLSYIQSDFSSAVLRSNQVQDSIGGLIDDGSTSSLLTFIGTDPIVTDLRARIDTISPYLSDAVLIALIDDKPTPLGSTDLVDILIENSPLTTEVYNQLAGRVPSLPGSDLANLDTAQSGVSERYLAESIVTYHRERKQVLRQKLTQGILLDSNNKVGHRIRTSLEFESDSSKYIQIAQSYLLERDFTKARLYRDSLTSQSYQNSKRLLDTIINLQEDTLPVASLRHDTVFLAFIEQLVTDQEDYAAPAAKSLLEYLDQYDRAPDHNIGRYSLVEIINQPTSQTLKRSIGSESEEVDYENALESLDFIAYPNPFKATVTFKVSGSYGELRISDLNGRVLIQKQMNKQGEITVSTAELASGVYVASYHQDGEGQTQTLKLVKY